MKKKKKKRATFFFLSLSFLKQRHGEGLEDGKRVAVEEEEEVEAVVVCCGCNQ